MGPIRGQKKKRKTDKKVEPNSHTMASGTSAASGSSEEVSADWFDDAANRVAMKCVDYLTRSPCRKSVTIQSEGPLAAWEVFSAF